MSDIMINPADLPKFQCKDCAAMDRREMGPVRFCLRRPPDNLSIPKPQPRLVNGIMQHELVWEVKSYLRTVSPSTPACLDIVPLKPEVEQ